MRSKPLQLEVLTALKLSEVNDIREIFFAMRKHVISFLGIALSHCQQRSVHFVTTRVSQKGNDVGEKYLTYYVINTFAFKLASTAEYRYVPTDPPNMFKLRGI